MSVANTTSEAPRLLPAMMASLMLATLLLAVPAHASRAPRVERDDSARRGPIAVEVKVGGGITPLFMASTRPDRWYLEARHGAKYEVRVRNTSGQRVGFVLTVDGLNAIDGNLSRNAANEPMYVLDPWESATIKGWRKDLGNVSRFVFVDEQRSYAERTGQGNGDLGWIRVTAFNEVRRYEAYDIAPQRVIRGGRATEEAPAAPSRERASNGMDKESARGEVEAAPEAKSQSRSDQPMADANPGTGWGPNQRDRVRTVEFEPLPYAAAQVILRYEYKPALVALGILPWRPFRDRTYERENGLYGFAQPPRDR